MPAQLASYEVPSDPSAFHGGNSKNAPTQHHNETEPKVSAVVFDFTKIRNEKLGLSNPDGYNSPYKEYSPVVPDEEYRLQDEYTVRFPENLNPEKAEAFRQQGRALGIIFEPVASPAPQEESDASRSTPPPPPIEAPKLPNGEPALWAKRTTGREVSPIDWLKLHYAPWLKGLSRPALRHLDLDLYKSYAQWIKRHPEDDLHLPTKSEVIDQHALAFQGTASPDATIERVASALIKRSYRMKMKS